MRGSKDTTLPSFLQGHDTTSAAITYSIYLLGRYPKYQVRSKVTYLRLGIPTDINIVRNFTAVISNF